MRYRMTWLFWALLLSALALAGAAHADSNFEFRLDDGEPDEQYVAPGDAVEFDFQINNNNGDSRDFEIAITNAADLESDAKLKAFWSDDGQSNLSGQRTTHTISLGGGNQRPGITLNVSAYQNALFGWWDIDVKCTDKSDPEKTFQEGTVRVHVDEYANLTVGVYGSGSINGSVDVDATTTYRLEIFNTGNRQDTFDMSVSGKASGWDVEFDEDSITLDAHKWNTVNLTITSPDDAEYGDSDAITVTGTSGNQPDVSSDLALETFVRVFQGLAISTSTSTAQGEPGQSVSFTLKVENLWSEDVNFETLIVKQSGWTATYGGDKDIPAYDAITNARLTVIIPSDAPASTAGHFELKVRVGEGEWVGQQLMVSVIGNYDISLNLVDSDEIQLSAGTTKYLSANLKVENKAKVSDLIYITTSWERGGDDWIVTLPEDISLSAGQTKPVLLQVKAPLGSEDDTAELRITATSGSDGDVSDYQILTLTVASAPEVQDPDEESLLEKTGIGIDPIFLAIGMIILGGGGAALMLFSGKGKRTADEGGADYSDEWDDVAADAPPAAAGVPAPPAAAAPAPPMAAAPAPPVGAPQPPMGAPAAPPAGPVTVACPSCQTRLNISDPRRPLTISCPTCATALTLSAPPPAAAPAAPPAAAPPPPAPPAAPAAGAVTVACPSCRTQLKVANPQRPLTIACPSCKTQLKLT